ncbi:MAG: type II secretion system protein GspM [Pseudomonadota bacterium]
MAGGRPGAPPRERSAIALAAVVVGLAVLWWIALAPALATLRGAPAQHRALDAQLIRMRALAAQAQNLQAQPRTNIADAARLLEASVRERLGDTARLVVAGERATLTLSSASGDALAQWLTQARVNARALPSEGLLNRNTNGLWDGTLVLTLPPR